VHIKATCPECGSTYQVDPGLKGKRMRCPNPICRAVFEVRDLAAAAIPASPLPAPAAPPLARPARTGTVGEVVPIVPAETADRRQALDDFLSGVNAVSQAGAEAPTTDGPAFAAWEDAPPVRQGLDKSSAMPQANNAPAPPIHAVMDTAAMDSRPRRGHRMLALLAGLTLAAVGACIWLVTATAPTDEAERAAKATKEYQDRNFADAASLFRSLVHDFPESEQRLAYQFHAELSDIRDAIHRTQTDVDETLGHLDRLKRFLDFHQSDPLIDKHREDVAESSYRLVEELTGFAAKYKKRSLLDTAKRLYAEAAKNVKPAPLDQAKNINAAFDAALEQVTKAETRDRVLAKLAQDNAAPSLDAVEQAPLLVQQAGFADDLEVKALVDGLAEQHRKSIKYSADLAGDSASSMVQDGPPSMAVLHYRGPRPPSPGPEGGLGGGGTRPVLVLVRGVLYALDHATGALSWARRVGIDTAELPLWLPATAVTPPTVLVASSEAGGLLALNANDGSLQWNLVLPEPCTGRPLLIGNRVFVACHGGTVLEIDVLGGRLLGSYDLGLELTHGGVRQPGTDYVCFAADRGCVFVLDVAQRRCAGILYTGHPSGSLRSPPVVLPLSRGEVIDPNQAGPSQALLLLCQDDGQGGTALLSYGLPIAHPPGSPTRLGDKLPGRVWYPPLCNPEDFSLVTDAGTFAVYGLRQRDNRDSAVFPMLRESLPALEAAASADRPVSLHSDGQNFWILAQGQLRHFQISMSTQDGWKIVSRPLPLGPVGSALHAGQVQVDDHGRTELYLVTESPPTLPSPQRGEGGGGKECWVTAVDLDLHVVRWQRQIGFVPQGVPLAAHAYPAPDGRSAGWGVLAWDRGGDLLLFDPGRSVKLPDTSWQVGGRPLLREQPGSAWLLPHADGKTAFALSVHGLQAKVWQYRDGLTTAWAKPLAPEAHLAGTPALAGDAPVLPLANGRLVRFGPGGALSDDEWRSPQADNNAVGHAVAVGPGKLACTNGSKGLTLWRLEGESLARVQTAEVKGRIISAPAVLHSPSQSSEFRLCVADVGRGVTLFQGDMLSKVREWTMSDTVTAGPFVRGGSIFVVVGGRRLVCLDPDSNKQPWAHTFRADIVAEPVLIEGALIVADESGQIQALDPATGQPVGLGYTLRAAVAPAGTPLLYGADRLFVPLSDGTVLLPSRAWFRSTLLGIRITH